MQTVFDNAMTAHVWAQQKQSEGRSNNGNFYFEGPTLYSYGSHYVVGIIDKAGRAWLNSDSSTMTTSGKHKPAAWRAVRHLESYSIPSLTGIYRAILALAGDHAAIPYLARETAAERREIRRGWIKRELESYFAHNWQAFPPESEAAAILWRGVSPSGKWAAAYARFKAKADKASARAKAATLRLDRASAARFAATPVAMIRARMAEIANNASDWQRERQLSEYCADLSAAHKAAGGKRIKAAVWTRLKLARELKRRFVDSPAGRRVARKHIASLRRLAGGDYQAPAHFSDAQKREALARLEMESRRAVMEHCHMPPAMRSAWAERLEALFAEQRAAAAIIDAERMAAQAAERAAWIAGEGPAYAYQLKGPRDSALIRAEGAEIDGCAVAAGELVTSQGARVPLAHAVRVFGFVRAVRERGQAWERKGGVGPRAGHFTVDSVEPDGSFRAGCHYIAWEETERLARELGIWDCPATALAGETDAEAA